MSGRRAAVLVSVLCSACLDAASSSPNDARVELDASFPDVRSTEHADARVESIERRVVVRTRTDARGLTPVIEFTVPPSTRSIHIAGHASADVVMALSELVPPGGADIVHWPSTALPLDLAALVDDGGGMALMPFSLEGGIYQALGYEALGLTLPFAPGEDPAPGTYRARFAASAPDAELTVRILFPEVDLHARVLHLVVHDYSARTRESVMAQVEGAARVLAEHDIEVVVDEYEDDPTSEYHDASCADPDAITCTARGRTSPLRPLLRKPSSSEALHLFVLDRRVGSGAQTSAGIPVISDGCTQYAATLMDESGNNDYGHMELAHEWGHALGLHHPDLNGTGEDPIPDTAATGPNLMSGLGDIDRSLTAGQLDVIRRSPLLRASREPRAAPADCGSL